MSALEIFHQHLDWTVEVHKIPNDEELETFINFVRDEIYSKGSGFRLFFDVSKVATTTLEDGMRCLHVAHQLGTFFRGLAPEVRCRASRGVGVITASVVVQRAFVAVRGLCGTQAGVPVCCVSTLREAVAVLNAEADPSGGVNYKTTNPATPSPSQ